MDKSYLVKCVRILRTPKIGPVTYSLLKQKFNSLDEIIQYLESINIKIITENEALEEINNHENFGSILIEKDMANYPEKLKPYSKHFPLISIKGNINIFNNPTIGVVGARQATLIGKEFTKNIVQKLRNKFTTVSGLAVGIDTIVAENSIDNHIGVMPGGINKFYPDNNYNLHEILSKNGHCCLISCQPFNMDPKKIFFPIRNQLIAAISDGLIIPEAQNKSGSMQTAHYMSGYNKPLWVVGGHPMDINYSGNNQLLKNKIAMAYYDEKDLEDHLKFNNYQFNEENYWNSIAFAIDLQNYSPDLEKEIIGMVSFTPVSINHITHYLNETPKKILSICIILEIKGIIVINGNMTVQKKIDNIFWDENV